MLVNSRPVGKMGQNGSGSRFRSETRAVPSRWNLASSQVIGYIGKKFLKWLETQRREREQQQNKCRECILWFWLYLSAESLSSKFHTSSYIFTILLICKYYAWLLKSQTGRTGPFFHLAVTLFAWQRDRPFSAVRMMLTPSEFNNWLDFFSSRFV